MEGSCLCRAIAVSAPDRTDISVCHCSTCRQWGSGPMLSVHCGTTVTFAGEQAPVTYRSSDWAERGFCPTCGTHLFYRLLPTNEYVLPAGLFRNDSFQIRSQIFIDEKPDYYDLASDTPKLTGKQVFANFAKAQGSGG